MALELLTESLPKNPSYLHRYIDHELDEIGNSPAIAIDGAKGVGKSETAKLRVQQTYFLDRLNERELMRAQLDTLLSQNTSILLDEWQHVPEVWDAVRRKVDEQTSTKFLLTGSALPSFSTDTHSGAGRILSLRMRPLSLAEREGTRPTIFIENLFRGGTTIEGETTWQLHDYANAICSTGLPGIYRLTGRSRRQAIASYVQRVIDRDVPDQGLMVRKPESMRAWWSAYAAASSTTTAYNKILDAATPADANKISRDAALGYRDVLQQLWLLDPVPAWFPNRSPFKKLTTGPKHQIFDPGIAATLLRITPSALVSRDPGSWELFGQLFESLATLTIRSAGQAAEAHTAHLRTQGGRQEVDLILERYDGKVLAFEVKLTQTPTGSDVRHLHWLGEQLGPRLMDKIVVTTGTHAYRRTDGVAVVPLALLG